MIKTVITFAAILLLTSGNQANAIQLSDLNLEFSKINKGSFRMGSTDGRSESMPAHQVKITQDFEIQKAIVTQIQWYKVMKENPSRFKTSNYCTDGTYQNLDSIEMCSQNPVENISWDRANQFIGKLNDMGDGYHYRLPTEAEYEYSERAGTTSTYFWGEDFALVTQNAWYYNSPVYGTAGFQSHPVAKLSPNAFDLYDMAGNVWEWTNDWYGEYQSSDQVDPKGPLTGTSKAIRGGGWDSSSQYVRSASRYSWEPTNQLDQIGFRMVRTALTKGRTQSK